jgi:hypothetical protein
MPRGKLLDLKEKPEKKHPLIEILGPIDIGKTPIAQLVAKRLKGTFIPFPVLDPSTITGRGLLASLTTMTRSLEAHPHWWAHIYAANLYEQKSKIEDCLAKGPVVVTNYTVAYKLWMNILGVNTDGFVGDMPAPNSTFYLYGDPITPTNRPKFDFSPELNIRMKRALTYTPDIRARRIILTDYYSPFTHVFINNICVSITSCLRDKFGCKVDEKELYLADAFLKKKDM